MFPSNSFSGLHLQHKERYLVTGRSFSPFTPMAYDLDDELIFEQMMLQEEQVNEVRNDGDINFTGSCNTNDGVDQAGLLASADRSLQQKVRPSKKIRSKVTGSSKSQLMPRKRTGKTDRHSKIHTAQGLRDRRIRLSVHIARRFFDLQEMLGLDKASKTIEWLLAESRDAIDELSKQNCSLLNTDSTPESAMESEIKEAEVEEEVEEGQESGGSKSKKVCEVQVTNCIKRDSRDKVRAREKMIVNELNLEDSQLPVYQDENPNSPSLDGGFLCTPENVRDSDDFSARDMNSLGIIEKFLGITSTATSSSPFPNFNLGDDYYEMIGGAGFLNGLNQPKYSNSVSGTTPN